jgi:hypothetical protein
MRLHENYSYPSQKKGKEKEITAKWCQSAADVTTSLLTKDNRLLCEKTGRSSSYLPDAIQFFETTQRRNTL